MIIMALFKEVPIKEKGKGAAALPGGMNRSLCAVLNRNVAFKLV